MADDKGIRFGAAATLGLLFCMNLLDYIDRNILAAVLPSIQKEMHLSDTQAGWLAPAFLVAYTVFAPIMGWAGDRYTRIRLLVLGVGLWSLATVGSGFAGTYGHLVIARSLLGIGEATYGTLAPTILADLFPRSSRGRVLSFFYLAIPVGSALGYVLGGLIEPSYGWRAAFFVVGGPGLLVALSGLLLREPPRGAMDGIDGEDGGTLAHYSSHNISLRDYGSLIHNRSYVHNTLGMALMTFALGGLAFWMPTFFIRVKGLSLQEADVWIGPLTVCAGLLGTITGGWLSDRLLRRTPGAYFLVSGSGMLMAAPFALVALWSGLPAVYLPATFVAEFFLFLNTGPCNAILVNVVNPAMRSSAFAINIFLIHILGDIWSPNAIGVISDATGGNLAVGMLLTVFAMIVSGILLLTGIRHLEHDQAAAVVQL